MTKRRFCWCAETVEEVQRLRGLGLSYTKVAAGMTLTGIPMTRGTVAGLLHRGPLKGGPRPRAALPSNPNTQGE